MQSPVKKIFITQVFGVNPSAYAKFGLEGHNGIDFRAFLPNGERCYEGGKSEVFAPHDGKIIESVFDANGYGWYVKIENDKEGSVLAHFSHQSPCKVGSTVKTGQFIGYQGTTGNSTGIHLHWGYYKFPRDRSNGFNGYINQEGLYEPYKESVMPDQYGDMVWKSTQHDETTKALFGADKDPRQTASTEIMATVNGYKADATTMRNRLAEVETEVGNREEQVGRLKEQLLKLEELRKADAAIYSEAVKAAEKLATEYRVRIESMQTEIDQVYKDKGSLLKRISVLEAENSELKKGSTRPLTLFDVISLLIPKLIQKLKEIKL